MTKQEQEANKLSMVAEMVGHFMKDDKFAELEQHIGYLDTECQGYVNILYRKEHQLTRLREEKHAALARMNHLCAVILEQQMQLDRVIPDRPFYYQIQMDEFDMPFAVQQPNVDIDLTTSEEELSDAEDFMQMVADL